ncbi:MAG: hypothetical protein ACYTEQ_00985 [Planctomycetota bacterium]|jgi:hypothetical protein
MDTALSIMMVCLMVCVAGLVLWLVLWAVDSWFRPTYERVCEVSGKDYTAAYTTTVMMPVGKVTVPQIQHHPEKWSVHVTFFEGFGGWLGVSEAFYNRVTKGDKFMGKFATGRLRRKNCYVKSIQALD